MPKVIMNGSKIGIAKLTHQDIDEVIKHINNLKSKYFQASYAKIMTENDLSWITRNSVFGIVVLDENKIIGTCDISKKESMSWASLGISIFNPNEWSKGYGTEAVQLIVKYGFEVLDVNTITLQVFSFNRRAIRVYEKVGFIKVGEIHKVVERDGSWHDLWTMEITREKWNGNSMG